MNKFNIISKFCIFALLSFYLVGTDQQINETKSKQLEKKIELKDKEKQEISIGKNIQNSIEIKETKLKDEKEIEKNIHDFKPATQQVETKETNLIPEKKEDKEKAKDFKPVPQQVESMPEEKVKDFKSAPQKIETKEPASMPEKKELKEKITDFKPSIETKKKKIKIVWTKGGGCNKSMYDALESYLKNDYDVSKFNPIGEALTPLDPVYKFTLHKFNGEDFYNFLLSHNTPWLANRLYDFGSSFIKNNREKIEKLLKDSLKDNKPDLIISNLPLLNYEMAEVAHLFNIKFLLLSPDIYMDNYFSHPPKKFDTKYTIVLDDDLSKKSAKITGLNEKNLVATGFPLRLDFFQKKDPKKIREDFSIPVDKPVVMILMGGTGSDKQLAYIRHLLKLPIKMHIISCAGNNKRVVKRLKNYPLPQNITMSVLGYTNRISDLMAVSNAIITKPGAATIMEAIEMQLPLIIDHTSTSLKWEKTHLTLIEKNQLGEIVTKYDDLEKILKKLFFDEKYIKNIKKNMQKFSSKNFPEAIKNVIKNILKD